VLRSFPWLPGTLLFSVWCVPPSSPPDGDSRRHRGLLWPAGALDTPARPPPAAGRSRANVCVVPDRRQRTTVMPPGRSAGAGLSVRNGLVLPSSLPNLFRRLTSGRYIPTHRRSRRIHDQRGQASPKAPRDPPPPPLAASAGGLHPPAGSLRPHTSPPPLPVGWRSPVGQRGPSVPRDRRLPSVPLSFIAFIAFTFPSRRSVWPSYPRSASDERTASGGLLTLDPPGL